MARIVSILIDVCVWSEKGVSDCDGLHGGGIVEMHVNLSVPAPVPLSLSVFFLFFLDVFVVVYVVV